MMFLLILNIINCIENEFTKGDIGVSTKLYKKKWFLSRKKDHSFRTGRPKLHSQIWAKLPIRDVSKCFEHLKFQYYYYDLESLKYSTIFNLSYSFYEELIKHPDFLETCEKIELDVLKDLPSKEVFKNFVIKFIIGEDFEYKKTKANKFIQSIAWKVHKHIVNWSQTHLTSYMFNKWWIVWQNIIDSIHIKTDSHCYWKVEFLFDGDHLAKTNEQLAMLERGEIPYPTLFRVSKQKSIRVPPNMHAIEYLVEPPTGGIAIKYLH